MRQIITLRARVAIPAAAVALAATAVPALAATSPGAGGWRVVATFARPKEFESLNSVVALSARDAWAAGGAGLPGSGPAVVVHWGGHRWRAASLPTAVRRALRGGAAVVAPSASDVWLDNQRHWARWNGKRWTTGRIPVVRRGVPQVGQLLAFGRANAWFIGQYFTGSTPHSFAEHFDGRSWRAKPAPPITGFLVAGASSSAICAINGQFGSAVTATTALVCWNGRRWRRVDLPATLSHQNAIIGSIIVRSLRDIWVGGGRTGNTSIPGIAAHWNGSNWHLTQPHAGNFTGIVFGLLVPDGHGGLWARSDCDCGGPAWRLWHYTGGRWVGPARPPVAGGVVYGIAAVPGTRSVWATGVRSTSTSNDGVVLAHGRIPR